MTLLSDVAVEVGAGNVNAVVAGGCRPAVQSLHAPRGPRAPRKSQTAAAIMSANSTFCLLVPAVQSNAAANGFELEVNGFKAHLFARLLAARPRLGRRVRGLVDEVTGGPAPPVRVRPAAVWACGTWRRQVVMMSRGKLQPLPTSWWSVNQRAAPECFHRTHQAAAIASIGCTAARPENAAAGLGFERGRVQPLRQVVAVDKNRRGHGQMGPSRAPASCRRRLRL